MVTVNVSGGQIITKGALSYGILVQSVGGGGGNAALSVPDPLHVGAGGVAQDLGSTGAIVGDAANVAPTNFNPSFTSGAGAIGLIAQAIGGGGGVSGVSGDADFVGGGASAILGGSGTGGGSGGNIALSNTGQVSTTGDDAIGILSQSVGGGGGVAAYALGKVTGVATTIDLTVGGSAGAASKGGALTFPIMDGAVFTTGTDATGLVAQSIGGGGGVANFTNQNGVGASHGVSLAVGSTGGAGGAGGIVNLITGSTISTSGIDADGLVAQSIGGGGGLAGFASLGQENPLAFMTLGGSGVGGSASAVNVITGNTIVTSGAGSTGVVIQSVGGGGGLIASSGAVVGGSVTLGATGGAGGEGGDVSLTVNGAVQTSGDGAQGVLVQSIGGGGGFALATSTKGAVEAFTPLAAGGGAGGAGGTANVTVNAAILATGANSDGLVVQSVGGGGGLAGAGVYGSTLGVSGPFAGSIGGVGAGAAVQATLNANVAAVGSNSTAVLLQSDGGTGAGNLDLTVAKNVMVVGGANSGVGVQFLNGADNTLTNHGLIASYDMIDGIAITASDGNDAVVSDGQLVGSINLGGGVNSLLNQQTGSVFSGAFIDLGAGNAFTNNGLYSPGGMGRVLTTTLTGNYVQSLMGTYGIDLDLAHTGHPGEADLTAVSGTAKVSGVVDLTVLDKGDALPGDHTVAIITAAGGASHSDLTLDAPVSAIAKFNLRYPNAQTIQLGYTINFSPKGLNQNEHAVGGSFNAIQTAGGTKAMYPVIAALFDIPNLAGLAEVYDRMTQEPYVEQVEAVRQSSQIFNDRLFSCAPRGGMAVVDDQEFCSWLRADARGTNDQLTSENQEFDETDTDISGGLETGLGHGWRLGGALSYENANLNSNTATMAHYATGTAHRFQGGAVVKKAGDWGDLALAVTGGSGSANLYRRVDFPGLASIAQATSTCRSARSAFGMAKPMLKTGAGGGRRWRSRAQWCISDALNEVHAGPLDLHVRAQTQDAWRVRPAIELGHDLKVGEGLYLRPSVKFGLNQAVSGRDASLQAGFDAAPAGVGDFRIQNRGDATTGEAGLNLSLVTDKGASLRVGVGVQYGDTTREQTGQIKLVVPF